MPVGLDSSYPDEWKYALKGNLHTHTNVSDGTRSMQATVDDYAKRGYGFLMLSDHDNCGDIASIDARGMILLPGVEVSANGPHMLQVGSGEPAAPDADRRKVIGEVAAKGGFVICNHPNWQGHFNHFPQEMLEELQGYSGIEIFNGCIKRLHGSPLATDRFDRLLTAGRKIWGHGVDDAHRPTDVGNAWDVVLVNEKSAGAVLSALAAGAFYASTGVTISDIKVCGSTLHVTAADAEKMVVVTDGGMIAAEHWGSEIIYELTPDIETYVRVECYGRGDMMAWTQPFYVSGNPLRQELAGAVVPVVGEGPEIKGDLSDPLWRKAVCLGGFVDIQNAMEAARETEVLVIAEPERICFGFRFAEDHMDELILTGRAGDLLGLYKDDSAEMFLDAEGKGKDYFHLIVNAAGVWGGARGRDGDWAPAVEVKTAANDDGWTLEVAVPVRDLGLRRIENGSEWGANFARNRGPEERTTCSWAWVGKDFHRPARFGRLRFEAS
ncbi:MAG: CehA/McbA family metallohydrolase [Planctomycetes bacterium]|nr:CehA/McbA family metallohydrolase [Planctomycetota bacterium]